MVSVADLVTELYLAEMLDVTFAATTRVLIVKVAVVLPPGTVTVAGTVALALLLESVTAIPAAGAGPFKVTVAVDELPPLTVDGLRASEVGEGALTVRVDVLLTVPKVAEMVDDVLAATA